MPLREEAKTKSRLFMLKWNAEHPIDFQWRKYFKIPFGSPEHLAVDFFDQQIWFEEMTLIAELKDNPDAQIDEQGRVIISTGDMGDYGMSQDEIEKEFEDMDLGKLNEKYGNG